MRKICVLIAALLLLCGLLYGCEQGESEQTAASAAPAAPTETTVAKYTVEFIADGTTFYKAEVEEGSFVSCDAPQIPGAKFCGWLDADGQLTNPETLVVRKNAVYTALLYADLSAHEPYLFADANRFLHPDAPLTVDDVSIALNMLAVSGAEKYIPALPEGTASVSAAQLKELLCQLFPAMLTDTAGFPEGETVTRAEFAVLMNALLERTDAGATAADTVLLPYDVSPQRQDLNALLEASLHHAHTDGDAAWTVMAGQHKNPAGYMNIDGWLYCVDDTGTLLRNGFQGELWFDANGRYTSGDAELDAMVAEILAQIIENNPGAERIDLLRRAFEYSRDSFQYLRRAAYYFGQTGWEIEDAKKMITTGRGNCYSYAAVFWALGRGLGYETIGISGTMTGTDQPHSWVEIYFDGTPYIFDPEMEMVYRFERDIFDKDMFMVTYEAGKYWNYKRP